MGFFIVLLIVAIIVILRSIVQIDEYERGVKFNRGKFSKLLEPGWRIILPIVESYKKVDIRTKVVDVPEQDAITKDNVSVRINAVIYYKIFEYLIQNDIVKSIDFEGSVFESIEDWNISFGTYQSRF